VSQPSGRTLWLLRHAKAVADPPTGGDDFNRVLAPRGRRDGAALGKLIGQRQKGHRLGKVPGKVRLPQVALVSPAARTMATAEIVLDKGAPDTRVEFPADLYGADPNVVLTRLGELGDDVSSAMVVGHNPTMQALAVGVLASDDKHGRVLLVRRGFPTCALAVIRLDIADWADVGAQCGLLYDLFIPPFDEPSRGLSRAPAR
jgi:phosphohistidine phosphatase